MRILIEEYQYNVADVKDILQGIDALENVEGRVSIHYVGYYYNTLLKDCVFILPKVLLKDVNGKELVFGKYRPEEIANLDENNPLELEEKNFLCKSVLGIYLFEIKRVRRITSFWGNELATVLIAVVCIALLIWVTLYDRKNIKLN